MNFRRTFSNSNRRWYCLTMRVLGPGQNLDQRKFVEVFQHAHDRQAADKLRDQPELDQVLGLHFVQNSCTLLGGDGFFLLGILTAAGSRATSCPSGAR